MIPNVVSAKEHYLLAYQIVIVRSTCACVDEDYSVCKSEVLLYRALWKKPFSPTTVSLFDFIAVNAGRNYMWQKQPLLPSNRNQLSVKLKASWLLLARTCHYKTMWCEKSRFLLNIRMTRWHFFVRRRATSFK